MTIKLRIKSKNIIPIDTHESLVISHNTRRLYRDKKIEHRPIIEVSLVVSFISRTILAFLKSPIIPT